MSLIQTRHDLLPAYRNNTVSGTTASEKIKGEAGSNGSDGPKWNAGFASTGNTRFSQYFSALHPDLTHVSTDEAARSLCCQAQLEVLDGLSPLLP